MYSFKQLVGALATPLVFALIIAAIAAACWIFGRRRSGKWLATSALALAYLAAIAPVADASLLPLETQYRPLNKETMPPVRYVVVLGSYYGPRDAVPVTSALGPEGLARIVEGVRLMRRLSDAQLIVSGGAVARQTPSALGYAKLARELGVDARRIVVMDAALDTKAEAAAVAALPESTPSCWSHRLHISPARCA